MEPFCNHLALVARKEIRSHHDKLIKRGNRIYGGSAAFIFGTLLSIEAYSVWVQVAS
jgi:hypothetical protein